MPDPDPTPDPGPAPVTVDVDDAAVAEGDGEPVTLVLPVRLSGPAASTVTVAYTVLPGTATPGTDYTAVSGILNFPAGTTLGQINVPVLGDSTDEPDETLQALLIAANGPASVGDAQALGTLLDDDDPPPPPPVSGLDARPANAACVAPARPSGTASVTTVDAFPAAGPFDAPTKILQAPGDGSRWFVLQKSGRVVVFNTANPAAVSTYLNISSRVNAAYEGGLLGMAFHPDFPATPEVFLSYTGDPNAAMVSKVSRFILDNPVTPTSSTEQVLLTINHPDNNHKGGDIAFGPDGYLYIGIGDGGGNGDPNDYGQNTRRLLGKMLRIDVLGVAHPSPGYRIPADNPFAANPRCGPDANGSDCPEIYAWGLRNPWRWSFDGPTGALWAADVGQSAFEEVNLILRGGNYGWRCREGLADFNTSNCPASGFIGPVSQYPHANGDASITGGFVYRGSALPALAGRYVFADFESGRIWALKEDGQGGYANEELADTPYFISAFGQGADGELYIADYGNGRIRRLVAGGGAATDTIPASLADTGCVNMENPAGPAPGTVPYSLNAPFWSDGASKSRHLALPDGTTISADAGGDWQLPPGTVLVKNFALNGLPVETRLLMRHPDGAWAGYTYEWNSAGTAATRVTGGKTRNVNGQDWIYPAEGDCLACHTPAAGFSLGLTTAQLNRTHTYAATGRTANQLTTLQAIGMLDGVLPDPAPSLPDPADASRPLEQRARAWLDTNCAQCHQPGGPTPSGMDLRYATPLSAAGICDAPPQAGTLGIANARLIAPGDASRSVVIARAGRRDAAGMPPLGSRLVDADGVALLTAWAESLAGCP